MKVKELGCEREAAQDNFVAECIESAIKDRKYFEQQLKESQERVLMLLDALDRITTRTNIGTIYDIARAALDASEEWK